MHFECGRAHAPPTCHTNEFQCIQNGQAHPHPRAKIAFQMHPPTCRTNMPHQCAAQMPHVPHMCISHPRAAYASFRDGHGCGTAYSSSYMAAALMVLLLFDGAAAIRWCAGAATAAIGTMLMALHDSVGTTLMAA